MSKLSYHEDCVEARIEELKMSGEQKLVLGLAVCLGIALLGVIGHVIMSPQPEPESTVEEASPFDKPYKPEPDEKEPEPEYPPSGKFLDGTTIVHKNLRHGYHVAIILNEDGKPYVYQGSPPKANRHEYEEYVKKFGKLFPSRGGLVYTPPDKPYTLKEVKKMKAEADKLLGTKYRPWNLGKGMNCCEVVANILNASGRNHFVPEKCVPDDFCKRKGSPDVTLNQGQQQNGDESVPLQSPAPPDMPTYNVVPEGP